LVRATMCVPRVECVACRARRIPEDNKLLESTKERTRSLSFSVSMLLTLLRKDCTIKTMIQHQRKKKVRVFGGGGRLLIYRNRVLDIGE
jgi:hypothetical protein